MKKKCLLLLLAAGLGYSAGHLSGDLVVGHAILTKDYAVEKYHNGVAPTVMDWIDAAKDLFN